MTSSEAVPPAPEPVAVAAGGEEEEAVFEAPPADDHDDAMESAELADGAHAAVAATDEVAPTVPTAPAAVAPMNATVIQQVLEQYGHNLPDEVDVAVARRWQALHIRGVDYFVTEDIASFFGVPPNAVEWLNLTSCNVLYDDPESARRHLDERSEAILRSELADDDALAALAWRVSFATTLGPRFLMRIATVEDVKRPITAEERQRYLQLHGSALHKAGPPPRRRDPAQRVLGGLALEGDLRSLLRDRAATQSKGGVGKAAARVRGRGAKHRLEVDTVDDVRQLITGPTLELFTRPRAESVTELFTKPRSRSASADETADRLTSRSGRSRSGRRRNERGANSGSAGGGEDQWAHDKFEDRMGD